MKKIIVFFLLLTTLFTLGASFYPSFTIKAGGSALIYEKNYYPLFSAGIEISILSYRWGNVTLSLPLSVSHNPKSLERKGLLVPQFFKSGIGVEILLDNRKFGGSIASFFGYEEYTDIKAIIKYVEARLSLHYIVNNYFSFLLPMSYTYTPDGTEVTASFALRIGGEIL